MSKKIQFEDYGDNFQDKSKYERGSLPHHFLDWSNKPETYKIYDDAVFKIKLPSPEFKKQRNFWEIIINRHSTRKFSSKPLKIEELNQLIFGMTGLTRIHPNFAFRTTPSAGGLYPIEVYPIISNVEDIKQGIYHYNIRDHELECLVEGDFREDVTNACLGQKMAFNAAINFIWTAIIERSKWKYLQRCYRYIYLDCGHIAQNFYLIAEALGLGACTIGAIFDDEFNNLLKLDGINETVIYVGVVGR